MTQQIVLAVTGMHRTTVELDLGIASVEAVLESVAAEAYGTTLVTAPTDN